VAIEPDSALAAYLEETLAGRVDVRVAAFEDAQLPADAFDLAVAASSFHWVEEHVGLAKILAALRPAGWFAMWWTLFGEGGKPDAFIAATSPLLADLIASPSHGEEGRPPHALDTEARRAALEEAGFEFVKHELVAWQARWDTEGISRAVRNVLTHRAPERQRQNEDPGRRRAHRRTRFRRSRRTNAPYFYLHGPAPSLTPPQALH
jgi:SAM-dependent methyltransferase